MIFRNILRGDTPPEWLLIDIGGLIRLTDAPSNIRHEGKTYLANNWTASTNRESNGGDALPSFTISGLLGEASVTRDVLEVISNNRTDVNIKYVGTDNGYDTTGIVLWTGVVGSIEIKDWGHWEIEIVGGGHSSDVTVGISHSVTCNHRFGDSRCQIQAPSYLFITQQSTSSSVLVLESPPMDPQLLAEGLQLFNAGYVSFDDRIGVVANIQQVSSLFEPIVIYLSRPLLFLPAAGERVRLVPGCDRTKASCILWNNTINFLAPAYDSPTTAKRLSAT